MSSSFPRYFLSFHTHMFCVEIDDETFYVYPPNQEDWSFEANRLSFGEDGEQWFVRGTKMRAGMEDIEESYWIKYGEDLWVCQPDQPDILAVKFEQMCAH